MKTETIFRIDVTHSAKLWQRFLPKVTEFVS